MKLVYRIAVTAALVLLSLASEGANVSLVRITPTGVTASIAPATPDIGKSAHIWMGAVVNGVLYLRDGASWVPYRGGPFPVALRDQTLLEWMPVAVVDGIDVSTIPGLDLYVGYGSTEQDMLSSPGKLANIFSLSTSTSVPRGPVGAEITEMWSDQLASIKRNGGTRTTESSGQASNLGHYILMGARDERRAHFTVGANVAPGNPSGIVLQLGVVMDNRIVPVGTPVRAVVGLNAMSIDLLTELPRGIDIAQALDFYVMAGIDANGNQQLERERGEILAWGNWRFRVVSQRRYTDQQSLLTSQFSAARTAFPTAAQFGLTFLRGDALPGSSGRTSVTVADIEAKWRDIRGLSGSPAYETSDTTAFNAAVETDPFSHRVGIDYANDPQGKVAGESFSSTSAVATAIRASPAFQALVVERIIDRFKQDLSSLPKTVTQRLRVAERLSPDDLLLAFGTGYFDVSITATLTCTSNAVRMSRVTLTGHMWDLYDWNYDSNTPISAAAFKGLASVQAGYGTLGRTGGAVFQIDVDLAAALIAQENRSLGTCGTPPPACANIAGTWTETATVTFTCGDPSNNDTLRASGTGVIGQQGCALRYDVAGIPNATRLGSITGNSIVLSGPIAIAAVPGVTFTENQVTFTGTVDGTGRRISSTGVGRIGVIFGGESDTCDVRTTSTLTR